MFQLGVTERRIANTDPGDGARVELLNSSILHLDTAVKLMPTEPTYHNNLGLSYFERGNEEAGDYSTAIQCYSQAIKLESEKRDRSDENLSFYHKNLGLAYYHNESMEEALNEYKKAIQLNDSNADNYFNRGNVWLN